MSTETVDTRPASAVRAKWRALTPLQRRMLIAGAAVDSVAKAAALTDLARRPAELVRGPKWAWAVALPVANSVGVVPAAYFLLGRRR